jgi:hypothetical protein
VPPLSTSVPLSSPAVVTESFHAFLQSLPANAGIVPLLGHDPFILFDIFSNSRFVRPPSVSRYVVQQLTASLSNIQRDVSTLGLLVYREDGSSTRMFLWTVGNSTPQHTVSYVRRQYCSCLVSLEPNGVCFEVAFVLVLQATSVNLRAQRIKCK